MRIIPRLGRTFRCNRRTQSAFGLALGVGLCLILIAVPAQASPIRGVRGGAWWAAWNLRHNASWTTGGMVSPRVTSNKAMPYQTLWAQRAQSVMDPHSLWNRYFARALATHELRVKSPNAVGVLAVSAAANGQLPQTPIIQYLTWRRSLNPARFDHYHPQLGPILQQTLIASPPPTVGGEKISPPSPPIVPPESPQQPEIPEPSSLAIAIMLLSAGLWARAHRRVG